MHDDHTNEWFDKVAHAWVPISREALLEAQTLWRRGFRQTSSKYRMIARAGLGPHPHGADFARRVRPAEQIELSPEQYRAFKVVERTLEIWRANTCGFVEQCAPLICAGAYCES